MNFVEHKEVSQDCIVPQSSFQLWKKPRLLGVVYAVVFASLSGLANAALLGRDLDGNVATAEAYYDDVADLTWLADANYAFTSGYTVTNANNYDDYSGSQIVASGQMGWNPANAWVASLDVGGITGWRLPTIPFNGSGPSEIHNLFYNVLGGSAGYPLSITHNANYDLFSNIIETPNQHDVYGPNYWLNEVGRPGPGCCNGGDSYGFSMLYGSDYVTYNEGPGWYVWAVHSGDVGGVVVPIPPAFWLFGSGLLGLIGMSRRKVT